MSASDTMIKKMDLKKTYLMIFYEYEAETKSPDPHQNIFSV